MCAMIFLSAYSCSIQTFIHPFAHSFIRGDPQVRAATWNAPRREFWRLEYAKITQSSASGGRVGRSMLPLLLLWSGAVWWCWPLQIYHA